MQVVPMCQHIQGHLGEHRVVSLKHLKTGDFPGYFKQRRLLGGWCFVLALVYGCEYFGVGLKCYSVTFSELLFEVLIK